MTQGSGSTVLSLSLLQQSPFQELCASPHAYLAALWPGIKNAGED